MICLETGDIIEFYNEELENLQDEIAKKHGLLDGGFRLVTNNGKDANQEVPHFHIHILGGENLKGIK